MVNKIKDKSRINYFIILSFTTSLFFISICASLTTQHDQGQRQGTNISGSRHSSSLITVDLFVRSQYTYSVEAEKIISPVIKKFQDKVDFNLYFTLEK